MKSDAARLLNKQIEEWERQKDSSDYVFKVLKFGKTGNWSANDISSLAAMLLFLDPKFAIREALMDRVTKKAPKMKMVQMIRTLERFYELAGSVKLFSATKKTD